MRPAAPLPRALEPAGGRASGRVGEGRAGGANLPVPARAPNPRLSSMMRAFRGHAPEIDASAFVEDSAQVIGQVRVGPGASVWYQAVVRGDINRIDIGARSNVQDGCVLHVT